MVCTKYIGNHLTMLLKSNFESFVANLSGVWLFLSTQWWVLATTISVTVQEGSSKVGLCLDKSYLGLWWLFCILTPAYKDHFKMKKTYHRKLSFKWFLTAEGLYVSFYTSQQIPNLTIMHSEWQQDLSVNPTTYFPARQIICQFWHQHYLDDFFSVHLHQLFQVFL